MEICVGKSRKHCGKRRKCWLPAFSPFPTLFSKTFFSRGVKSLDCVVKSSYGNPFFNIGGATLYIETILKKPVDTKEEGSGKGKNGSIELTGNLKTVMKESVHLAYTVAKSYMTRIDPDNKVLEKGQIHIHAPEVWT